MMINKSITEIAPSRYGDELTLKKAMAPTCSEVVDDVEVFRQRLHGGSNLWTFVSADIVNIEKAATA
jgi:hypothetical protein